MYEQTWSQPLENYQQTGSFLEPATPPSASPDAGTLVQLPCVNEDWLPLILGALDQLRNPSSWPGSLTDLQRYDVLGMADRLRQMIAMGINVPCCNVELRLHNCVLQFSVDGGVTWTDVAGWVDNFNACVQGAIIVPPPLLPPGTPVEQRACNIAEYLSTNIIHQAITAALNGYDTSLSLLAFAGNVAAVTFAFDLPWTAAAVFAAYDLYQFFTAGNIAALRASEADSALWSAVTCAIFEAIRSDGAVTAANCSTVIANICGISYVHPIAITAICQFVTDLGCDQLRALQAVGALAVGDCSGCPGGWCYYQNFKLNDGGWTNATSPARGAWVSGVGWELTGPFGSDGNLDINLMAPVAHPHITEIQALILTTVGSAAAVQAYLCTDFTCGTQQSLPLAGEGVSNPGWANACPFTLDANVIRVTIASTAWDATQPWVLQGLQIRGTGVNPFGVSSCIHSAHC